MLHPSPSENQIESSIITVTAQRELAILHSQQGLIIEEEQETTGAIEEEEKD